MRECSLVQAATIEPNRRIGHCLLVLQFELVAKLKEAPLRDFLHVVYVEKEALEDDKIEIVPNPTNTGGDDHRCGHNEENEGADHRWETI